MALIQRVSDFSGFINTMEIPLEKSEIEQRLLSGKLITQAFPELNADQREFLMTGMTPVEWEMLFGQEDDEEEF